MTEKNDSLEKEFEVKIPEFLLEFSQNVATLSEKINNHLDDYKEHSKEMNELEKKVADGQIKHMENVAAIKANSQSILYLNRIMFAILTVTVIALIGNLVNNFFVQKDRIVYNQEQRISTPLQSTQDSSKVVTAQ